MITEDFINKIFKVSSQEEFNKIALEIFHFQYENNKVYNQWCNLISKDISSINNIQDIPFLPISFFRSHKVISFSTPYSHFFKSSGTTNTQNSYHYIYDLEIYQKSFIHSYQTFLPNPNNYVFIALLPNYLSQGNSSLIYMIDYFIRNSNYKESGFYKDNLSEVIWLLKRNKERGIKTILFATTYALLDLIELEKLELDEVIVFETGGMKGRRKEMIKQELYSILKEGLGVKSISSEYGMCELLSQAYSLDNGVFFTPNQMKVMIRDIHDPFTYIQPNKVGGINVIDLANIYSCSFIATDDLGLIREDGGFQIRGRMENSVIRGCNLMYEE